MARTVNEKSPIIFTVVLTDEEGAPLVPSTAEWRVDDVLSSTEVVGWTNIPGPTDTLIVTVAGEYNMIIDEENTREGRVFGIRINDGLEGEAHDEYKFHVLNLFAPESAE